MPKPQKIQPLPYPVYFWTVTALTLAGLANAVYLFISHYRNYTDIDYSSFCAISQSINCDTVSQSSYSVFLRVPVPVWGIIGFGFFLMLLSFARPGRVEKERIWTLLFLSSLIFSGYSIVLALISMLMINSFCLMCIVSYGISFALLFYTWLVLNRFSDGGFKDMLRRDVHHLWQQRIRSVPAIGVFLLAAVLLPVFFPVYWSFEPPVLSAYIPTGTTPDGHPWVGAEDPKLVITEYADYMCFQCNKTHYFLRRLMVRYPGRIRIVHRQFPMDHRINPLVKKPMHSGSAILSMLAIYAAQEGKFWQMSDLLFSIARRTSEIDLAWLAQETGLSEKGLTQALGNRKIARFLRDDIAEGLKAGVTGTPSFIIDGKLYQQRIPREIIAEVLK